MCRANGIWRQCPSLIWPSTCPRPQSWSQAQRWVGGVCAGGTLPQGQAPVTQDLFFFFCLASISRLKTRAPRCEGKARGRGEGGDKGEEEGPLEGEGRKEGAESQLASATRPLASLHPGQDPTVRAPGLSPGDGKEVQGT